MVKNRNSLIKQITLFVLAFCSVFGLVNKPDYISNSDITQAILTIVLFWVYKQNLLNKKILKGDIVLSSIFSLLILIGYTFHKSDSWICLFKNHITVFSTFMIFLGDTTLLYFFIQFIRNVFKRYNMPSVSEAFSKINLYRKHPFLFVFAFISIFWIPYVVAYYPGMYSPDANVQIGQFFGLDTSSVLGNLINPAGSMITGHHPVAITFLFGGFIKFFQQFTSTNVALFIFVLIQSICMALIFTKIICYFNSKEKYRTLSLFTMFFYTFVPFFPNAAMMMVKDTISVCFFLLFTYYLLKISNKDKVNWIYFTLIVICMSLSRKEYVYIILITLILFMILNKKVRKNMLKVLIVFLCVYEASNYLFYTKMQIPEGSKREMLSIPFQQTARLAVKKGYDVYDDEDKKIIAKVLSFDTLIDDYRPRISDPVKGKFNEYATKNELNDYFKVWLKYGLRYPRIYLDATINNTYGYFYPGIYNTTGYSSSNNPMKTDLYAIKQPDELKGYHKIFVSVNEIIRKLPGINMFCRIAFYTWCLIFCTYELFRKKCYSNILNIIPFVLILAVCIISPVSGNFRYSYGMIFGLPIIFAICSSVLNNEERMNEKICLFFLRYREILIYLITGLLTTIVSIFSYFVFSHIFNINYLISNFASWICAVLFAYITNKVWVFQNKNFKIRYLVKEFSSFTASRFITLLIDMFTMFIIVSIMKQNDLLGKLIVQVIVTILNYIFSKLFVFNTDKRKCI